MTTDERIAQLEEHLTELRATQADLVRQLGQARVDQWQARIEDLELQVHLGAMDSNERITQLSEQLRNKWDRTRAQWEDASATASTVAETLRSGLESAYRDVRQALIESRGTISH
ncbi:hypothetical protein [Nocardioides sp.]|uniref:hypothetical protein n=1 Tax=Nocardioides sp. TaxID=35761 RepID=UPI003D13E603